MRTTYTTSRGPRAETGEGHVKMHRGADGVARRQHTESGRVAQLGQRIKGILRRGREDTSSKGRACSSQSQLDSISAASRLHPAVVCARHKEV